MLLERKIKDRVNMLYLASYAIVTGHIAFFVGFQWKVSESDKSLTSIKH